jgi:hypothetical protein
LRLPAATPSCPKKGESRAVGKRKETVVLTVLESECLLQGPLARPLGLHQDRDRASALLLRPTHRRRRSRAGAALPPREGASPLPISPRLGNRPRPRGARRHAGNSNGDDLARIRARPEMGRRSSSRGPSPSIFPDTRQARPCTWRCATTSGPSAPSRRLRASSAHASARPSRWRCWSGCRGRSRSFS